MREKPSPPNIIDSNAVTIINSTISIDFSKCLIPFINPPRVLPLTGIPDTGSMDGIADYGNDFIYLEPVTKQDHEIMVNWIIEQFENSKGLLAADCVYRIMYYDQDDPLDFSKPNKKHGYAIHRLHKIAYDKEGVKFKFKGVNNLFADRYWARPKNILWISAGVLY